MARAAGISPASVQRLWAASEIKPHLWRTFEVGESENRWASLVVVRTHESASGSLPQVKTSVMGIGAGYNGGRERGAKA